MLDSGGEFTRAPFYITHRTCFCERGCLGSWNALLGWIKAIQGHSSHPYWPLSMWPAVIFWSLFTFSGMRVAIYRHVCLISPLSRSDAHRDRPPEIVKVNKFHRIRLLCITACVHVVCDYCSVTPEADPGYVCHVPHVYKECRHVSFTRFLHFNMQRGFALSCCCCCCFFPISDTFFYDIKLHHSKQLASFLFLITAALAVKTARCSRPQAPECFCWSLQRLCKCFSFQFYGWLFFFWICCCVCVVN